MIGNRSWEKVMGFTITTPQISALVMHACCDHLGRYISLRDF